MAEDVGTAKAKAKATERRTAPRHSVIDTHLVTVDLSFQSGALLLDLSATGIGVQALAETQIGATTEFHFELPGTANRIDGVGRVAWTADSGRLGIHFDEIAEMCRPHLAQWLSRERRPPVAPGPARPALNGPLLQEQDEVTLLRRDLLAQRLQGDPALAFIVERIRGVTGSDGAAIVLEHPGGFLCRASSGAAPVLGARLDPSSGLSGECVRNGEVVRCEDTETDPRADRFVCRKLDLRSAVIVPVKAQARVVGVLEVFSSQAHGFQSSDVLLLRDCAELVSELMVGKPAVETTVPPPAPARPIPAPGAPPVEKAPPPPVETAAAVPELHANAAPVFSVPPIAPAETTAGFEAWEALDDRLLPAERVPSRHLKPLAAALVVTVVAAGAWLGRDRLRFDPYAPSAPLAAEATSPPPVSLPSLPATALGTPAGAPPAAAVIPAKSSGWAKKDIPVLVVQTPWPAAEAPAPEAPPDMVVAGNGGAAAAGLNSVLSAPAAAPSLEPPPVSQGVTGGKLIARVEPQYPPAARHLGVRGEVVVQASVDARGRVVHVTVLRGAAVLAGAAVAAIKRWRWEPLLVNGVPTPTQVTVHVKFTPKD
jgi:TonB family protein